MSGASDVATIPGWYGKLPTLGDFASRRLEADFIEPWDLWLGEALQALRVAMGEEWLDAYLNAPPWRFVLSPGVLPGVDTDRVFAGVLMPSVDRVGRHFPLTLAASLPRVPGIAAEFDALLVWMHRLEDTALDALQSDWTIDDLERALAELAPPGDDAAAAAEDRLAAVRDAMAQALARGGGFIDIASVSSRFELAAVLCSAPRPAPAIAAPPGPRGVAFWLADVPGRRQLLVSEGLPSRDDFAHMFGGAGRGPIRGAAARGVPLEDDGLMTLPQVLSSPLVEEGLGKADETDLLGLFQSAAAPTSGQDPVLASARNDDILALFGVGAEAVPADADPQHAPKTDDVLALFDVRPTPPAATEESLESNAPKTDDVLALFGVRPTPLAATEESPESDEAQAPHEGRPKDPDILDLFGGPPVAPDDEKAR